MDRPPIRMVDDMCLAIFCLDTSSDPAFVAYETRDQAIHHPHGHRAAARLGLGPTASYAHHWRTKPDLLERVWTLRAATWSGLTTEPILGGLDAGGGTWLAVNERSGVYARILVAPNSTGALGESPTESRRAERAGLGYVSRSGLPVDAATYASAAQAAVAIARDLPAALARDRRRMLPFFLLVGDARSAFVLRYRDDGVVDVTPVAENTVHVLSVRGLDSPDAALTDVLRRRLAGRPRPTAQAESWNPWLDALAVQPWLSDRDYREEAWRSHRVTAVQPPYLNTGDASRHRRASWPSLVEPGEVEWTKSTSCTAIGADGLAGFLYEERHVEPGEPWPTTISAAGLPTGADDYTVLEPASAGAR